MTHADEDFKAISHDLRVWTLYETIDSRLSGGSSADGDGNVYFTAPLASMKSAILGMRQEHIFPLQADHANVASFGRSNQHTLRLFLRQLASLISRADASVREDRHGGRWTLNLEQRVNVEVHGFFEDPASANGGEETLVRAWSTKLPLKEFLRKGPEECLIERLNEVEGIPEESRFLRAKGKTMSLTEVENQRMGRNLAAKEGLGIKNQLIQQVSPPTSPILRPIEPDILATSSANMVPIRQRTRRLSSPPPQGTTHRISTPTRYSTPMRRTSPLIRADFDQDLAIDRLSPVPRPRSIMSFGRSISDQSPGVESSDFPPFFQPRSRSSIYGEGREDEDVEPSEPLPEAVLAIRKVVGDFKNRVREKVIVGEVPVAFVKPDVSKRKFVWVHLPYNNPSWVKVSISHVCCMEGWLNFNRTLLRPYRFLIREIILRCLITTFGLPSIRAEDTRSTMHIMRNLDVIIQPPSISRHRCHHLQSTMPYPFPSSSPIFTLTPTSASSAVEMSSSSAWGVVVLVPSLRRLPSLTQLRIRLSGSS